MDLFRVPTEVIETNLFPFLHVNDILRLRRVCKLTKNVADDYLYLFGEKLLGEIIIDEERPAEGKSFKGFMDTGFTVSKINLKIGEPNALGSEDALDFIETHGSSIKELTVNNMYCCVTPGEFQFYQSLTNLDYLEIQTIDTVNKQNCRHPTSFCKTLKKLKINEVIFFPYPTTDTSDIAAYVSRLNVLCDQTEYVKEPCYRCWGSSSNQGNYADFQEFGQCDSIRVFNTYDLSGYRYSDFKFHPRILTIACIRNLDFLRLVGLDTNYFRSMKFLTRDYLNKIGRYLQSITNVSWIMLKIEDAPNLEEIDIYSTARCSTRGAAVIPNRWPHLKKLSMCVDSTTIKGRKPVKTLFDQFFRGNIINQNLEELALSFDVLTKMACVWPKAQSIITSCPNVKNLKLKGWPGTNKELSQLWGGLQLLEYICLEDCGEMGDDAFVGDERENPALLKLKNLRKLELRKVDRMTQITDDVFELVFRHTTLTHFIIQSDEPIQNVTLAGIRALLTGDFAHSIAKFPFQGWSLAGVPEESFKELGAAFRSSYMV